jgi:hypothetical protein
MSIRKCPKCRAAISFEATDHPACGWNVRDAELKADEYGQRRAQSVARAQAEAEALLERENLDSAAAARAYRREHAARFGLWTEERILAHWRAVLAMPLKACDHFPGTHAMAREALRRLGSPADPEA